VRTLRNHLSGVGFHSRCSSRGGAQADHAAACFDVDRNSHLSAWLRIRDLSDELNRRSLPALLSRKFQLLGHAMLETYLLTVMIFGMGGGLVAFFVITESDHTEQI
jgi:hypothetical protein